MIRNHGVLHTNVFSIRPSKAMVYGVRVLDLFCFRSHVNEEEITRHVNMLITASWQTVIQCTMNKSIRNVYHWTLHDEFGQSTFNAERRVTVES